MQQRSFFLGVVFGFVLASELSRIFQLLLKEVANNMEKYQLSFSATNLPRRWSLAKPSPYVTAKILSGTNQGKDLGETEIIESTTNAEWVEVLFFECSMAEKTELEVILWDSVRGKEPVPLTKITIDAKAVFNKKGKFTNEQIGRRKNCL